MGVMWCGYRVTDDLAKKILADEDLFDEFFEDPGENGEDFDIDKSWDVIHFLATGQRSESKHPLSRMMFGGKESRFELSMGPAMYQSPEMVKTIAAALEEVSDDDLRSRYDPQVLAQNEIYPGKAFWQSVDPSFFEDYILDNFHELQEQYAAAAQNGQAMFTCMQ